MCHKIGSAKGCASHKTCNIPNTGAGRTICTSWFKPSSSYPGKFLFTFVASALWVLVRVYTNKLFFLFIKLLYLQKEFEEIANHFQSHEHVRLLLKYDESLSHLIYAASDMLIIPSIFEPCGLTQVMIMLNFISDLRNNHLES